MGICKRLVILKAKVEGVSDDRNGINLHGTDSLGARLGTRVPALQQLEAGQAQLPKQRIPETRATRAM